jgi:hypothetical protein
VLLACCSAARACSSCAFSAAARVSSAVIRGEFGDGGVFLGAYFVQVSDEFGDPQSQVLLLLRPDRFRGGVPLIGQGGGLGPAEHQEERSMARWLSERRREAADGSLHPACRDGLAPVPGWAGNPRAAADEARWHERLAQLADFRAEGNDWPRHHDYASEREHTLGVWIHTQRYKHRRDELATEKVKLLDQAVPGWQTGRTRGRPSRQ